MTFSKTLLCLSLALSILAAGCTKRGAEPIAQGNTLHVGNSTEPSDLDPQTVTGRPESKVIRTLIEGLVIPDPVTLEPRPGQAESWEISEDGRVYTFHLRPEAKWSNGDTVTAQDFVGSWQRILTPSLGSEYAYNLFLVVGGEAYNKGELTDFSQTGFKALDDRTIEVTLVNPTGYFLDLLTHYSWHPVHLPTVEKFGGLTRKGTAWTRAENYVSNGPFVLAEWIPNQHIEVRKSPTYWGRDGVKLDAVRFYPIESTDTEERMFRTGQLDVTDALPLSKIDHYRDERKDVFHLDPYLAAAYFRVNVNKPQLSDPRVRRALALAIDRDGLAYEVQRGVKTPAHSFTPQMPVFNPPITFEDNVEKARALLAEAGYPGGKGLPAIEILYPTSDTGRIVCEALQAMLSANLGIDVRLYNQEWKVYLDTMNNQAYDMAWSAWIGDYADPMTFLDMMVTDGGNNRTGWSNARYDALVAEAGTLGDAHDRAVRYSEMEQILGAEVPVIPLYFYTKHYVMSPAVKGWHPTLLDIHPLQNVWLERE
ncbi:peptide ABC transporter substrate-binding protein [Synoicihabitans lomoniglobus]|uniref:Peptide ABC transporter substrate-binding protein n=1 Tax=Synoicihabitans lomoniglobus TaxID=2909285 RepID=A0AAE9ZZU8_9BACT|nr:peptide ABC transporter substrate-binding protein [Opitutaceae bacterium LMO-M01]WED63742.1 peptide ABC transporter substrate-binding protein [Opitutaceae bacterium LMO-M01]